MTGRKSRWDRTDEEIVADAIARLYARVVTHNWSPPDPLDVVLRSDSPYVGTALHSSFNRVSPSPKEGT